MDIRSATTVRNNGTINASQGMWLSADTLINDGTMDAGERLAIATTGDTLNRGRLGGGAVTVNAGRDMRNQGAIVARDGDAVAQAGRDFVQTATGSLTAVGSTVVNAGRDLRLDATTVTAGEHLVLGAGRDLSVTAKTGVRTIADGHTVANRETLQATQLQAGGNLVLQAGRDATLQAAQLQAGDAVAIAAGRDLQLSTLTTTDTSLTDINGGRFKQRTETLDETVHGTTVQAGGDIAMTAGRDAILTAAEVVSDEGGIAIAAGRDLTLASAEETHHFEQDTVRKKSGFLSSKTTTTHDETTATYAIGTTLSGETVDLAAGNDLLLQAATVAGTGDVSLVAGNDITIQTAQNTVTEAHSSHTKKSGLFGTGGIGFTIGTQTRENTADITELTHTGSLVGSTEGRVDIVAGGDVAIAGSDVLSKAGIGITGENVAITAVENSLSVVEAQKFRQAGLNVSLKGGVVDTAMAVYGAAKRADEVEDDRLKALYAAQAGQTLFSNGQAGMNSFGSTGQQVDALASTNKETKASGNSGLSLRIGIGASKSDSKQTYTETTATGSRIASEGDVAIVARSGDVTVTGSQIEGDNVALAAARDLILQSTQESSKLEAHNQSSSGEIGITIGTEAGIGVYVSASMAKGEGNGAGTTHAETTVEAADTLTLISGRDTTLEGAQAIGETVIANVGRNLTLTSQQDTNDYEREDMAAGIDVAVGFGGGSASGYYNQSDIESTYTSVNEQTGIQAGAGGFDIEVGGHTELTGAAIASTADAALNRLSTESLAVSDLYNEAAYEATSFGVSASGGSGGGSFTPSIAPPQSEDSESTTRSGISAGVVDVRNGDQSALDDVDRSVTELQQSGLKDIFDEQEVREGQEFAAGLSTLATQIVDDIYSAKLADKQAEIDAVETAADEAIATGDIELAGELYEQVAYMRDQRDEGQGVVIAKSIVGVAISALAGNVSLESGLTHSAINSGIAVSDDAANKAMRGHDETVAMKVTCAKTAQECADLRIPDGSSMEQRIDFLRDNGMTIEFVSEIPEGAGNIAVNGILNDQARAAQVQIGHVERNDGKAEGTTYYVQYNASKGGLSDLMQAGYDKFVSPVNNDYSATTVALVGATLGQGKSPTNLFAHSWGTIVTRNALNMLVDAEYKNPNLTVAAFGPAVRPGALFDPMEQIVGEGRLFPTMENEKPALYYFSSPNDPVATFVGGTIWLWPSSHLDSNSPLHLPGGAPGSVWGATKGWVPVIKGPENDHSCYGLNCQGTSYNWTEQNAAKYKKEEEGEPAIGGER